MNFQIPQYKISPNCETELLTFLKVAKRQSEINNYVDLNKYQVWKTICPLDGYLKRKLDESIGNDIIEIEDSDKESVNSEPLIQSEGINATVDDIAFAIKENLENQKKLGEHTIDDIRKCPEIVNLFILLTGILNDEDIINFGFSLKSGHFQNEVIHNYCQHLLMLEMMNVISENLLKLLEYICAQFPVIFKGELLKFLLDIESTKSKTFMECINSLKKDLKSKLLRDFIYNCEKLNENSIEILDNLLTTDELEHDILHKLVDLLSHIADDYSDSKIFGKLLLAIMQNAGNYIINLRQPLKYIVNHHKSIWRVKLQKHLTCLDDSVLLSQITMI